MKSEAKLKKEESLRNKLLKTKNRKKLKEKDSNINDDIKNIKSMVNFLLITLKDIKKIAHESYFFVVWIRRIQTTFLHLNP
jgi:hypothetical protein